jgi:hypothetical protein
LSGRGFSDGRKCGKSGTGIRFRGNVGARIGIEAEMPLSLGRCASFQRVQFLAWFEAHGLARGDAHLGASPWVAANAGLAGTDAENAKSAQFNALTGGKSLLQALEDRIHRGFCLGAGKARALDYMMDDVLLNQWGNLAGKFDCTTPCGNDATDFNEILEQPKSFGSDFSLRKPVENHPKSERRLSGKLQQTCAAKIHKN